MITSNNELILGARKTISKSYSHTKPRQSNVLIQKFIEGLYNFCCEIIEGFQKLRKVCFDYDMRVQTIIWVMKRKYQY